MKNKAREFLKSFCKCDETCNINYKPYEYGSIIERMTFEKALERFIANFDEMKNFFNDYGVNDENGLKAFKATCEMWKKHLIVF